MFFFFSKTLGIMSLPANFLIVALILKEHLLPVDSPQLPAD